MIGIVFEEAERASDILRTVSVLSGRGEKCLVFSAFKSYESISIRASLSLSNPSSVSQIEVMAIA